MVLSDLHVFHRRAVTVILLQIFVLALHSELMYNAREVHHDERRLPISTGEVSLTSTDILRGGPIGFRH